MSPTIDSRSTRRINPWRTAAWCAAAALLLAPLVAMQFTDEVVWTLSDFVFAAIMLGGTGLAFELALRKSRHIAYRAGAALGLAAAFVLVWVNAAVGIIGDGDGAANLLFGGVLAAGAIGALTARFQPRGMARAMIATAGAQGLVAAIAVIGGLGAADARWPFHLVAFTGVLMTLWLLAAGLFQVAASAGGQRVRQGA